jgi:hypothetical protein
MQTEWVAGLRWQKARGDSREARASGVPVEDEQERIRRGRGSLTGTASTAIDRAPCESLAKEGSRCASSDWFLWS